MSNTATDLYRRKIQAVFPERAPVVTFRGAGRGQSEADFLAAFGVRQVTAKILHNRGISSIAEAENFLTPTLRQGLPNPASIKNIEAAAELILDFIASNKRITVFTDFDVDGVSAGAQLVLYLGALGARVSSYTPNRFREGYGLNSEAIENLARAGCQLLVTVDCGISNNREIALARRLGMHVIVLDHHEPHLLPEADIIVDPAQDGCPFQEHRLCAAGLVWMLLIVVRKFVTLGRLPLKVVPDPKDFLDLAALGTICDMVPLIGPNRVIAYRGLEALKASSRPGIVALRNVCGVPTSGKVTSYHVGFGLGPRLNAAGRMSDAREAFELLITNDSHRAEQIARKVDRLNAERQSIESEMKDSCIEQIVRDEALLQNPAFAIYGESFHAGVIGIVAQRLVENFCRPAAVIAPGERDGGKPLLKGSVRGAPGFHVAEALASLSALLVNHGGHAEAGGFSLLRENLAAFQRGFVEAAAERLGSTFGVRHLSVDAEVSLAEIDLQLADELARLSPFGAGNPAPLLLSQALTVEAVAPIGEKHVRLRLRSGSLNAAAVGWNMQGHPLLRNGEKINAAFSADINTYQGLSSVQLSLKHVWR